MKICVKATLKNTEIEIQELTNQVFSLHNKLENLHALQSQSQHRLEELQSANSTNTKLSRSKHAMI